MLKTTPIGVFDSGIGGVSVLKHIRQLLPHEDLIYSADSRHAPFGNKSPEFIRERSHALTRFLIGQGTKAIVVACNTATAGAITSLREHFSLPIIGMEPAVKPAAAASKSGVIGVLATIGTLKSSQFVALLESYGRNVQVVTQACHGLVECVERGEFDSDATRALIARYLQPLLAAGADTIVLGCTHYPFLRQAIVRQLPPAITLIDTGEAVARQVQKRLQEAGLLNDAAREPKNSFWINRATDAEFEQTLKVIAMLWDSMQWDGGGGKSDFYRLPESQENAGLSI
ncbi:glutamate racemase [Methylobacter marinus]|uniref:glutamate racemase n=1 Tax=Methylobacter marinus TaxID=34058 RepID=UPI0018DBE928|nr:glutamate racemase [Methylobacter marinus]